MASAWIYQDAKQVEKHGPEGASWYVGYYDPEGKKRSETCGRGPAGKRRAEKLRRKREAELMTGTFHEKIRTTWQSFRKDYEEKVMAGMAPRSREEVKAALTHFERLINPARVHSINTTHIDAFVAARRQERGKKVDSHISPATINKELRHLRSVLAVAHEWGHLPFVPKFRMERVPQKLPSYVTGEHFAAIYQACDEPHFPKDLPFPAADWWRGLLMMGYMTGWRISEMLALRWQDVDLKAGTALTRAEDNKGKRDAVVKLHPVVVEHLAKLVSFEPLVFPCRHYKTTIYKQFAEIQETGKVRLSCTREHQHTRFCHVYGFHDLRRAFATMNAEKLTPDALQALMRHKSYSTTQGYIAVARQLNEAVAALHVPDVTTKAAKKA